MLIGVPIILKHILLKKKELGLNCAENCLITHSSFYRYIFAYVIKGANNYEVDVA